MAGFDPIDLGSVADDRTGDDFRAGGTKINTMLSELFDLGIDRLVVANKLSDFPVPVAGIILLLNKTEYLCGNDIDFGTNRIVMGAGSVLSGVDNAVITLSRTGAGDFITALNVQFKVKNLTLSTPSGRCFNQSDNTDTIFRVVDCIVVAANFGIFNSASGTIARFTNVSTGPISAGGCLITGSWGIWLWEVSAVNLLAGDWFDIGVATFQSFIADTIIISLASGSNFLKGTTGSANIKAGGIGQIRTILNTGLGSLLDTISINDALWEFFHNPNIPDTRPDALMSMQSNATVTTGSGAGYTLVAGTWVNQGSSQYEFTAAGRFTYKGGKPSKVPLTYSLSAEPVSGNAKIMAFQFSINGVLEPDSKRTGSADAGKPANITMVWQNSFETDDFVEIFVTNDTDSIDVLVSSSIGRID